MHDYSTEEIPWRLNDREQGVRWSTPHSPRCFWCDWTSRPWLMQWKCSRRAWAAVLTMRGLFWKEEGRQLGEKALLDGGCDLAHTGCHWGSNRWPLSSEAAGTTVQDSPFRMAAKEQHGTDRTEQICLRWQVRQDWWHSASREVCTSSCTPRWQQRGYQSLIIITKAFQTCLFHSVI